MFFIPLVNFWISNGIHKLYEFYLVSFFKIHVSLSASAPGAFKSAVGNFLFRHRQNVYLYRTDFVHGKDRFFYFGFVGIFYHIKSIRIVLCGECSFFGNSRIFNDFYFHILKLFLPYPRLARNSTLPAGFSIIRYLWFKTSSGFRFFTKTMSRVGRFLKLFSVFTLLS